MERKKKADEEMLITHLPPVVPGLQGREVRDVALANAIEGGDVERLTALVSQTHDPGERARIVESIQRRLGNEMANRVVAAVRADDGRDETGRED